MNVSKEHVLKEIQRITQEKGGTPPGSRIFENESGIKVSDLIGKYWIRWSDALKEAGCIPNKKTEAYESDWLLERLSDFTRQLGHLPLRAELKIKSKSDPSFPHYATIVKRLGLKSERRLKIAGFCRGRSNFQDVLAICNAETEPENPLPPTRDLGKIQEVGYVYLLKSGRFYKIGKTNSVGRRAWELGIQLPEKIKPVHVINAIDDPTGIEEYWHRRFAAKRKNGEWFDLNAADVSAFRRRRFM